MKFGSLLVVMLPLLFVPAEMSGSTSYVYTFGSATTTSLSVETPTNYAAGYWTESNNTTDQNIDCVVTLTAVSDVCGAPGNSADGVTFNEAPGNTTILNGATSYMMVDGTSAWGAPVWFNTDSLTSLTPNTTYTLSFDQASNEENPNDVEYNDNWLVYLTSNGSAGSYTPGGTLTFASDNMDNKGAQATAWQAESFTFTTGAGVTSEIVEFVTNAVRATGTGAAPPLLDLSNVALTQESTTPEPGTWTLTLIGIGAIIFGCSRRRRTSATSQELPRA